jgi:hypothetical protein
MMAWLLLAALTPECLTPDGWHLRRIDAPASQDAPVRLLLAAGQNTMWVDVVVDSDRARLEAALQRLLRDKSRVPTPGPRWRWWMKDDALISMRVVGGSFSLDAIEFRCDGVAPPLQPLPARLDLAALPAASWISATAGARAFRRKGRWQVQVERPATVTVLGVDDFLRVRSRTYRVAP